MTTASRLPISLDTSNPFVASSRASSKRPSALATCARESNLGRPVGEIGPDGLLLDHTLQLTSLIELATAHMHLHEPGALVDELRRSGELWMRAHLGAHGERLFPTPHIAQRRDVAREEYLRPGPVAETTSELEAVLCGTQFVFMTTGAVHERAEVVVRAKGRCPQVIVERHLEAVVEEEVGLSRPLLCVQDQALRVQCLREDTVGGAGPRRGSNADSIRSAASPRGPRRTGSDRAARPARPGPRRVPPPPGRRTPGTSDRGPRPDAPLPDRRPPTPRMLVPPHG